MTASPTISSRITYGIRDISADKIMNTYTLGNQFLL